MTGIVYVTLKKNLKLISGALYTKIVLDRTLLALADKAEHYQEVLHLCVEYLSALLGVGLGRNATDFTMRYDIGPAKAAPDLPDASATIIDGVTTAQGSKKWNLFLVDEDLKQGMLGAQVIPQEDAGKDEVIVALEANHELQGEVFEDVPESLSKWHAADKKESMFNLGKSTIESSEGGDLHMSAIVCRPTEVTFTQKKACETEMARAERLSDEWDLNN
eukprot:Gb_39841 [translate_table: standard]